MKNKAFTLIELLVVVLIIGILTAIAVPQYRKAVDKAQITKIMPLVDAILKGQEMYFLTHGEYAFDLSELDIDVTKNCIFAGKKNNHIHCPGLVLNNGTSKNIITGTLDLYFCPSQNDPASWSDYMPCYNTREFTVTFYYQHAFGWLQQEDVGKVICSSTTERGKYLESMFCQ